MTPGWAETDSGQACPFSRCFDSLLPSPRTVRVAIGKQCIVNTKASIDHDNVIENGAEISPGATLCGMVGVGSCAWIAAGATVLPLVKIGADATVGAGAVVNKNVPDATTVVGIPAKPING